MQAVHRPIVMCKSRLPFCSTKRSRFQPCHSKVPWCLLWELEVWLSFDFWTCREHSFDLIWTLSLEVWKPSWRFHACQIPMAPTMWTLWFCIWYIFSPGFWFPSSTVSLFYFFLVSSHWVDSEDHTAITARAYSSDTLCRRALERVSWLFWIFHVACLTPESFACFPD